jgi:hypothetical protein
MSLACSSALPCLDGAALDPATQNLLNLTYVLCHPMNAGERTHCTEQEVSLGRRVAAVPWCANDAQ